LRSREDGKVSVVISTLISNLRTIVCIMLIEGLCAVHTSKRVHRDVSSGNILLVPASGSLQGRGVITNLEYVKDIRDTSLSRDVKTVSV
jgi:serine/threonine protein kinase